MLRPLPAGVGSPKSPNQVGLGRDLSYGWGLVSFIAGFGVLLGLNYVASRSEQLAIGLLFGFGVLIGVGTALD